MISLKKKTGAQIIDSVIESFQKQVDELEIGIQLENEANKTKREVAAELIIQADAHNKKALQGETIKLKIQTLIS